MTLMGGPSLSALLAPVASSLVLTNDAPSPSTLLAPVASSSVLAEASPLTVFAVAYSHMFTHPIPAAVDVVAPAALSPVITAISLTHVDHCNASPAHNAASAAVKRTIVQRGEWLCVHAVCVRYALPTTLLYFKTKRWPPHDERALSSQRPSYKCGESALLTARSVPSVATTSTTKTQH